MKKPLTLTLGAATLCATAQIAHAACPSWPTQGEDGRFTISGEEVADKRTGLIWKRCSEGQTLTGNSCTGTVVGYTHEQALAHAKSANTSDNANGWRLPNVKELASLADKGCQNPAIDSTAFPGTSGVYWSSSPYVSNSSIFAWNVSFDSGYVGGDNRNFYRQVRLVRTSQ